MHRLFWKIFLSFWFSLILFAGASLLATSMFLEHTRAQDEIESPRARLISYTREARDIASIKGVAGLESWLRKLDRREAIPFYLLNDEGEDLLKRPVSSRMVNRMRRLQRPPPHHREAEYRKHRPGLIVTPDGSRYRLVADYKSITLGRVLSRPRVIAIPVILAAIISGIVCLLLARYLTTPIHRLSRTAHQFAAGDLSLRVSPAMGKRHDEIADLAHDFDHMAERLQTLIHSQKQLLIDVSHELRSPLARLQVALGLAHQAGENQSSTELDRIELETERLNELIGQLLSLSRLEAGTLSTTPESVDLTALLTEVAENADFEAQAGNRQVRIIESVPATIQANETLLISALENVVRNAVKYTDIHTSVELSLQPDLGHADRFLIQVSDHGPGVPEEMLPKLFKPFVRIGEARDRNSGGYGLGLAIAKRAIQLHYGEIVANNNADGGLTVRIYLPETISTV